MGNANSTNDNVGYRILGVQSNSPGSACNFAIYFDFIIAATTDNIPLCTLDSTFVDIIQVN